MRILGEIDQEGFKITVFKHEEKISIKFEKDMVEYLYKFRSGSVVDDLASAKQFVEESMKKQFAQPFTDLLNIRDSVLQQMLVEKEDEFPSIL